MRIMIVEDDLASRKFLFKFLTMYGDCDITVNGMEAVEAFLMAWDEGQPYDLICMDIMMPKVDGYKALKTIRGIENQRGIPDQNRVKVIMTTALNEPNNVFEAFDTGCEAYAAKPIDTGKLLEVMRKLGLPMTHNNM
jgi:two-component system chemotaxis response regulator CheY